MRYTPQLSERFKIIDGLIKIISGTLDIEALRSDRRLSKGGGGEPVGRPDPDEVPSTIPGVEAIRIGFRIS